LPVGATGWRAESPGEQTVRFLFEAPQRLRRIRLLFREEKEARTQEFVLRWSPTADGSSQNRARFFRNSFMKTISLSRNSICSLLEQQYSEKKE
jgi:hypothetical protein